MPRNPIGILKREPNGTLKPVMKDNPVRKKVMEIFNWTEFLSWLPHLLLPHKHLLFFLKLNPPCLKGISNLGGMLELLSCLRLYCLNFDGN